MVNSKNALIQSIISDAKTNHDTNNDRAIKTDKLPPVDAVKLTPAIQRPISSKTGMGDTQNWTLDSDKKPDGSLSIADGISDGIVLDGMAVFKILGVKIDLTQRSYILQQEYMDAVIQARDPQYLVRKFGQLKQSALGLILTKLGIAPDKIQSLSRQAIDVAIADTHRKLTQLLYSDELTQILKKKISKKDKKIINTQKNHLTTHLDRLIHPGYWTKVRDLEAREQQVVKILGDFEHELTILNYHIEMMGITVT